MNIRQPHPPGLMGFSFSPTALTDLFRPQQGRIIEAPGAPAALSMGVVLALGAAILVVANLKKKRLL